MTPGSALRPSMVEAGGARGPKFDRMALGPEAP
jgi:hypothetical protein